ncbi:MAG: LysR family transcriptional regulator, partial [Streptosporangiales bacterium]|nr:LysR family transcriptional regulator [Streptosporangiales bacterium]
PNVSVRIGDLRDEEAAAAKVREGHCEVVFSYLPVTGGGVSTVELGTHDWWLVFPPGTPLPAADPLPLSALPDIPLVIVPKGSSQRARVERALSAAGKRTRPSAIVQQREAALSLVFAGLGATVAERGMAQRARERGAEVRAISPALTSTYGVVYAPSGLTPAGEAFLQVAYETACPGD